MADSGKRVIVDGIDFGRVWLFPRILGAVTAAMQPARIILALFMVVLLIAVGRLWDRSTDPNVHPAGLTHGRYEHWLGDGAHQQALLRGLAEFARDRVPPADELETTMLDARNVRSWMREGFVARRAAIEDHQPREDLDRTYRLLIEDIERTRPHGDFEATVDHVIASFNNMIQGALELEPRAVLAAADQLIIQTPRALWTHQTWFAVIYGLVVMAVLAVGGGAISRIAAVQQSSEQRLGIGDATDFAVNRVGSLIAAHLWPLVVLAILAAILMGVGFLMRVPVLDVILAVFYFIALLMGFLMAFLIVGYVIGFPLLAPAVACEGCDGADAMQRTYAYVVNRPLHALWYWAVGIFGLAIGFAIVGAIAYITINATGGAFATFAGDTAAAAAGGYEPGSILWAGDTVTFDSWHERWAAGLIGVWQSLVVCLLAAYVVSYLYSAATVAYLLMRRASDGQEIDEVWKPGLVPGTMTIEPRKDTSDDSSD